MTTESVRELTEVRHARARRAVLEDLGLVALAGAHRVGLNVVYLVFVYRFAAAEPQPARAVAEALAMDYRDVLRADAVLEEAELIVRDPPRTAPVP